MYRRILKKRFTWRGIDRKRYREAHSELGKVCKGQTDRQTDRQTDKQRQTDSWI